MRIRNGLLAAGLLTASFMQSAPAFAGQGYFITIKNETGGVVSVKPYDGRYNTGDFAKYGAYQSWYPRDFETSSTVAPYSERRYYTETCESKWPWDKCGGWARLTMLIQVPGWPRDGHFDLAYYVGGDSAPHMSCFDGDFRKAVLKLDGSQYVGTVRVRAGGLNCE